MYSNCGLPYAHTVLITILAISFTLSLPLLLILVFHIQRFITYHHAVIHISPCELIKEQRFSLTGRHLCFVVLSHAHEWKRPAGRKTMLSALTHLTRWHWHIRHRHGRENILSDSVTLCRNLGKAESAVTHSVVNSTVYDYDNSARFTKALLFQLNNPLLSNF